MKFNIAVLQVQTFYRLKIRNNYMSTERLPSTISIKWDSGYRNSASMSVKMRHMCSATCTINEHHKRSTGVHRSFITSKIIILGDVGVGKTKLTEKFCLGKDLSDASERTIRAPNAIYEKIISKSSLSVHLKIFDTAGQERYRSITSSHYRGAQGCLLVFDVTNEDSFQSISSWHDDLNTYCDATDIPIILVGTIPKLSQNSLKNPPKVKLDDAEEDDISSTGRKLSTDSIGERSDTYERSSSRLNLYSGLRKISTEKASSYAEHLDIPYMEVEMEDQSQISDVFEKLVDCISDKAKKRYNLLATNANKTLSSEELWKQYCKKVTSYKCSC